MTNPTELPHSQEEHNELQFLLSDLARWFETPTGQAYKTASEDTGMPGFAMHLLMDTVQTDPQDLPITMTRAFMLGSKFMRDWMNKRQAEPLDYKNLPRRSTNG